MGGSICSRGTKGESMVIVGVDLSLNHAGYVKLTEEGKLLDYAFVSDTKKRVTEDPDHGYHMEVKKRTGEDRECFDARRMNANLRLLKHKIWDRFTRGSGQPIYVGIEGYAYGQSNKSNSIFQIAEWTGLLKNFLYTEYIKLRIHDPASAKFFSVGKGNATKKEMVDVARAEGCSFEATVQTVIVKPKNRPAYEDYEGPGTDVVDAYFLARLVWMELQLRRGLVVMSELPEYQIKTFNRVTKSYPVNILARDFISMQGTICI